MKKLVLSSVFCLSLSASFLSYPQAVLAMDDDSGQKALVSKLSKHQHKKAKKERSRENRHQRKQRAKQAQARNERALPVVQQEPSANNASALSLAVVVSASNHEQSSENHAPSPSPVPSRLSDQLSQALLLPRSSQAIRSVLSVSKERKGASEERKYSSARGESLALPVIDEDRGSGSNSMSSLALPDGRQWVLDTLYGNDCEFNSWYHSRHGYICGAGHKYPNYPSNKKAFKAGFRKIVLNEGSEDREKEVLLPTREVLRYYFREWAEFPPALVRDYPHEFSVIPADRDLDFSWTALCDLSLRQDLEGDHYFLDKLYSYFSTLQKLNAQMKGEASSSSSLRPLVEEAFDPSDAAWLSGLGNFLSVSRYCPNVFSPCKSAIEKLYRVSFLKVLERGGLDERWSKNMTSRLHGPSTEFMLNESVAVSQSDQLVADAEQEILRLARARWRTTQAMGHHLQLLK